MASKIDAEQQQNKRFGELTENDCAIKGEEMQNKNTISSEQKSCRIFKEYLQQIGVQDTNFFLFTEEELDKHLSTFWWNARTRKGTNYTASSIETIRYSINRALQRYGHNYDITSKNSLSFVTSNKSFQNAQKDRKQNGLGVVKNTEEIPSEG